MEAARFTEEVAAPSAALFVKEEIHAAGALTYTPPTFGWWMVSLDMPGLPSGVTSEITDGIRSYTSSGDVAGALKYDFGGQAFTFNVTGTTHYTLRLHLIGY